MRGEKIPLELAPLKRGRKALSDDDHLLPGLELSVRVAKRDHGKTRTEALLLWAEACVTKDGKHLFSVSTNKADRASRAKSVAARWQRKLHASGYDKLSDEELLRRCGLTGVDLSAFTVTLD